MEKRTLLAIVLCIMVIILYNIFLAPKVVPPSPQALVPEKVIEVPKEEALPLPEIPIIESRDIMVETDLVKAIFTTQGARLKSYWLKNYDYELIYPTEENKYPLSLEILGQPGLISENWKVDKERLILNENNPTGEVRFTYLNPQGLKIIKTLTFDNDAYKIGAGVSLQNTTFQDVYIPDYRFSWGPGIEEEKYTIELRKLDAYRKQRGLPHTHPVYFTGEKYETERVKWLFGKTKGFPIQAKKQEYKDWLYKNRYREYDWLKTLTSEEQIIYKKEKERKTGRRYGQFSGPVSFINGKLEKDTLTKSFIKGPTVKVGVPTIHQGKIGWVALKSKYFIAALVPPEAAQAAVIEKDEENKATVGIKMAPFSIKEKETISHEFTIYSGPKDYELVKELGLGLESAVDLAWWSWVAPISLLLLRLFKWLYQLIPNYGVAIILITILTKVILLPFTQRSFTHMRAMQAIQPKINALREKHKDKPQELNRQMMRLYKEHKVNPLGGCLPMILQMPIFFALFGLLYTAIDLREAWFIWWIKDLSLPDTVGYLAGFSINILPILMGLTTVIQQKMTTVDPRQAKMMLFMPVFMTFIFYNFASGLVLYWSVTNILTIGQQYIIAKRMPTTAQ